LHTGIIEVRAECRSEDSVIVGVAPAGNTRAVAAPSIYSALIGIACPTDHAILINVFNQFGVWASECERANEQRKYEN